MGVFESKFFVHNVWLKLIAVPNVKIISVLNHLLTKYLVCRVAFLYGITSVVNNLGASPRGI